MKLPSLKRTPAVALALGTGLLAGCSLPPLTVHDNGAAVALARATLRPAGAAGGGGLELELGRVRGSQLQAIEGRGLEQLGGVAFDGPLLLNEATHQWVQLVYHHRLFAGRTVEMAWFVGAAAGELDWRSTEQQGRRRPVSLQLDWAGATGGASGRWNLTPTWFAEARVAGSALARDARSRSFAELALGWQATPALQLRLGMASSAIERGAGAGSSSLSMRTRGPFAALVLGH